MMLHHGNTASDSPQVGSFRGRPHGSGYFFPYFPSCQRPSLRKTFRTTPQCRFWSKTQKKAQIEQMFSCLAQYSRHGRVASTASGRCQPACAIAARAMMITSSARASTVAGISMPSTLAVLRLITSSTPGRRLHRQVRRPASRGCDRDVAGRKAEQIDRIRPMESEDASGDHVAEGVDRRQSVPSREHQ